MSDPALSISGLFAGYGGAPIVKDFSLTVQGGTITAIVGPNGAGKSTLMKAVLGILRPSQGSVSVNGIDVTGHSITKMAAHGVGYVPQVRNVFPSLSVEDNLKLGAYGQSKAVIRHRLAKMLALFPDLVPARKRNAGTLSGGQRNMLATARALMSEPHVLLLDEPTAGLSPRYTDVVWEHVTQVRASGVAIVVVEQNTRRALRHADWACVLQLAQTRRKSPRLTLEGIPVVLPTLGTNVTCSSLQNETSAPSIEGLP